MPPEHLLREKVKKPSSECQCQGSSQKEPFLITGFYFAVQRLVAGCFLPKHTVLPGLSHLCVFLGLCVALHIFSLAGCTCSVCSPKERLRLCQICSLSDVRFTGIGRYLQMQQIQLQSWKDMALLPLLHQVRERWGAGTQSAHSLAPPVPGCAASPAGLGVGCAREEPHIWLLYPCVAFPALIQTTALLNTYWYLSLFFSGIPVCMYAGIGYWTSKSCFFSWKLGKRSL